jgi:uncharacterized protein YkwD
MAGGTLTIASGLFVQGAFGDSSPARSPVLAQGAAGFGAESFNLPPAAPLDPTSTPFPETDATEPLVAADVEAPPAPAVAPTDVPAAPTEALPAPTEPPATATPRPVSPATVPPTQAPPQPTVAPPQAAVGLQPMERAMFDSHNVERANAGLESLTLDARLVEVARRRAQDMAAKGYFAHTSPTGETAFTVLEQVGYAYQLAGENIARNNYPDSESVRVSMTGFMNSPSHRGNILEPKFRRVGIGLAFGADGMKYFAVVFSN